MLFDAHRFLQFFWYFLFEMHLLREVWMNLNIWLFWGLFFCGGGRLASEWRNSLNMSSSKPHRIIWKKLPLLKKIKSNLQCRLNFGNYIYNRTFSVIEQLSCWTIQSSIKIFELKMPQWSNKCSEFEHTSRTDKNETHARMTAEVKRTRPNGWPSLPEQHCISFRTNRSSNIILEWIMFENRGSTIYIYIYILPKKTTKEVFV